VYRPEICAYCDAETFCEADGYSYPECRACRVERFFECVLFAPKNLRLLDWQRRTLRKLFGAVDDFGLRQYRQAYISVAKKNGKSFLVGGLPIYHMVCEVEEERQEAYGAAAAKDQAGIVFRSAAHLVRGNTALTDLLKVNESTKRIVRRDGGGFYAVISADGDVQDGIEPSLGMMDELHRWKGDKAETLYDVITKGTISRREPLVVEITTAGEIDNSPICWREHEYAQQILSGSLRSDRFYAEIWSANQKRLEKEPDYWKSRQARVEANPSHEDNGGFLKDERIVDELHKAEAVPEKKPDYLRYHLNSWVQQAESAIELSDWDLGDVPLRPLIEKPCYAGIDLSSTTDITAVAFLFPDEDGTYDLKVHFWMPEGQISKREEHDRVPYSRWITEGYITATPGNAIDYRSVKQTIKTAAELYDLREIAFDPWHSRQISLDLIDEGYTCIEIRQGYATLSEPTKKTLKLIVDGKVRHGGNPVMRWMAGSVSTKSDGKDNIMFAKPDRRRSSKRIDGFAAWVNAQAREIVGEETTVSYTGLRSVG
jgi:phage terminase large subunit-like protein